MKLKKLYLTIIALVALKFTAFSQAGLKVTVTDQKTKEAVPFATVVVFLNGVQAGVQNTDFDGVAIIKPLTPGKYNVKVNFIGYQTKQLDGVVVGEGNVVAVNIPISNEEGVKLDEVQVVSYVEPLVDPNTVTGSTITREEYQNMATKNINSVASTSAGVYQSDEGASINVRGSRSGGTQTFIDGERVIGSSGIPQSSVEQVSVLLGGLPAMYGDATGGVISITTRGPQSKFFGGIEGISSQLTDAFGYNFLGFSVGGPIISKKDTATGGKKAVLGFILSGQGTIEKDNDPSAVGVYRVKKDKLKEIEDSPLRPSVTGTGVNRTAEFLTMDDLEHIKARENITQRNFVVNGKIDFKPTNNLNFTLGASYDYTNGHGFVYEYSLLNPVNNPQTISSTFRTYARVTQKFGNSSVAKDEKSSSNIKNAFFTMQVGYTSTKTTTQDDNHKKNFFDYGYIGKFEQTRAPSYSYETRNINDGTGNWVPVTGYFQNGFQDVSLSFAPSDVNPLGANYTKQVYEFLENRVVNYFDIQQNLGLFNGDRPIDIYNLYSATGRQYNGWSVSNNTQFRVTSSFSADIKDHAIQIGIEYDQRDQRAYSLSTIGLWTRMRQLVNVHTAELDTSVAIYDPIQSGSIPYYNYNRKYNEGLQTEFSKNLLTALGLPQNYNGWVDIDNIDRDKFNIDMFSAEDLMLSGAAPIVSYYGYDHTGKKLTRQSAFDDYLNGRDAMGYRTYAQAAFRPIYMAGYIQDKFDFKDLKFNIGLRVDRYDANQKVLKDKYLFKEARTVAEVNNLGAHPENMASDAVVYVDDATNPTKIVGYRNGDTWYNSAGAETTNPTVLAQATTNGTIQPYLLNPSSSTIFESSAFKDYKPQINLMPRVAFSFPISDVANFFAHYDLLCQRPTVAQRLDLTDYEFIFNNTGIPLNNPDLRSEKTTDYELGFTQILNEKKNSALKITSYYRELRDLINIIRVSEAYPRTYLTYSNIDFGTVKGFQFEYDLRRTGGISLTANYTLQFADGSGSSAGGNYNLANSGFPNLRVTLPLDFDQRHTFTTTFDYRFGEGSDYRGPVVKNKKKNKTIQILKNVGANMVLRAGSGTPYTRQATASAEALIIPPGKGSIVGSVNGSYKPWQFRADLRIDKNFELEWGKAKEGDKKKQANLNVYLQVLNLFNTKNVVNVFSYTGNPNDDGYLASPLALANINSQISPQAFTTLYSVKANNPNNYSRPRVIRIGLQLDF